MSTSKTPAVKAALGFNSLSDADLLVFALTVIKAFTGNAAFPNPTVPLTTLTTDVTAYSNAITAAEDGGKNARAIRDQQRKIVLKDLKALAVYAETNCNDDPSTFVSSGFTAKSTTRTSAGPVAVPTFKKLDYGAVSGSLLVYIKAVAGAKSYNLRYAALNGATTGPWTVTPLAIVRKAVTVSNLTPGTTYAFQVQALGNLGYTDWSDSATIMCT